jgi:hypothetical protein
VPIGGEGERDVGVDVDGAGGLVVEVVWRAEGVGIGKDERGEGDGMREVGAETGMREGGPMFNERAGRLSLLIN